LGDGAAVATLSVLLERVNGIWMLCAVSRAATLVMLLLWASAQRSASRFFMR
jgi:hypothetical protein